MSHINEEGQTGSLQDVCLKTPSYYKVILHNDDYTTMDFVILVLKSIFKKNLMESERLMLKIHKEGLAVCGVYTYEIAEAKMIKVIKLSRENTQPLKCTMEEVNDDE